MRIAGIDHRFFWALFASVLLHGAVISVFFASTQEMGFSGRGGRRLVAQLVANKQFDASGVKQRQIKMHSSGRDFQKKIIGLESGGGKTEGQVYLADEVDIQPEVMEDFSLEPLAGVDPHLAGEVEIWLLLSREGEVNWISIVGSTLPEKVSSEVAAHFAQAAFRPAIKNDEPVAMLMHILVSIQAADGI